MSSCLFVFAFALCLFPSVHAQQKITVEDIYMGAFRAKGMDELQAMPVSNRYTVLAMDRATRSQQIEIYDFATLEKVQTLLSSKDFPELAEGIDEYRWDASEKKLLIATKSNPIYRHSFTADYYVYDVASKLLKKALEQVQEPRFSPDGSQLAYVKDNNLSILNIATGQSRPVTQDGKKNHIINGLTDWVYEEEFAFVKAFDWSTDGHYLAYMRFDESQVPEFSMSVFAKNLYPQTETFKYPKAGEKNALVSLHVFNVAANTTQTVNLSQYTDFYIARLQWTRDPNLFAVQVLNRHQDTLDLLQIDARTAQTQILIHETDAAYVDVTDHLTFLSDNRFIWSSEKSGFNHLYLHDKKGKLLNAITSGNWEVTAFYGVDEKTQTVFYQSVEQGSLNRDVFKVALNGKNKSRLTTQEGTSSATFSTNYANFIHQFSSATEPPSFQLRNSNSGALVKPISNNSALTDKLKRYNLPKKDFFELTTAQGNKLNAWIMKPNDFDATKKYPLLMYQYSGPGSQEVSNSWLDTNDYWFMSLAQQGYLVACVDGRGTGYKGAAFKKCTQKQLGKLEVEDQIAAAKVFGGYPYIDAARIGIFGWSFGGFMASNCLFKGADVFKTAIAVAPVTNWRYYDSIYTERYLQTPQENASGYDDNSPIYHVEKLKGNLLLIHGTADDNVHVQNSMEMIEALVQANKNFDWAIYPDKNHGIYGGKTRIQLFNKMTQFILNKL
ncbi:MAG: S9 family peptidase [Flavobacterium sp. BFFFF2]|nr:MAG: S9 family peptidase [Flavobacterium sp. BFFFF2]